MVLGIEVRFLYFLFILFNFFVLIFDGDIGYLFGVWGSNILLFIGFILVDCLRSLIN